MFAASRIAAATSAGCDNIGTWLDDSVVVVACMRFAAKRSCSGGTIRSFTMMKHDGLVFQAAVVIFSERNVEFQSPCVSYASARSGYVIPIGILGLRTGNFTPVWAPVSKDVPAREFLVYLRVAVSLASGLGLVLHRTAAGATRLLVVALVLWFVILRLPRLFRAPRSQHSWSGLRETAAMVAGGWVLYAWLSTEWDHEHVIFEWRQGSSTSKRCKSLQPHREFPSVTTATTTYAGKVGTVQIITYTGESLFSEYKNDFKELRNGLQIAEH